MLSTKVAPGTGTQSERQPADPERPDDGDQGQPAGQPNDGDQDAGKPGADAPQQQPGKPDAAADGKEQGSEAADKIDWKARYEDTETKRRDTQSKLDKRANADKEYEQNLRSLDTGWRGWIERNAPEAHAKLVAHEESQGKAREDGRNARSRSDSVILSVYRDGDKAFGDYLTDLADSGATISSQSLERHRETFSKYAGSGAQNGSGDAAAPPKTPSAPAAPPRSPGAGRPQVEPPPVWDGKTFASRKYLTEGLAAGDARGRTPRRPQPAAR